MKLFKNLSIIYTNKYLKLELKFYLIIQYNEY